MIVSFMGGILLALHFKIQVVLRSTNVNIHFVTGVTKGFIWIIRSIAIIEKYALNIQIPVAPTCLYVSNLHRRFILYLYYSNNPVKFLISCKIMGSFNYSNPH